MRILRSALIVLSLAAVALPSGGCALFGGSKAGDVGEISRSDRLSIDTDLYATTVSAVTALKVSGNLSDDAETIFSAAKVEARKNLNARKVKVDARESDDDLAKDFRPIIYAMLSAKLEPKTVVNKADPLNKE